MFKKYQDWKGSRKELINEIISFENQNPEKFRMIGFTSGEDAGKCQLSVDTLEGFQRVEQLLGKTSNKRSSASTADLLGLADIHSRASAGWDPNSTGQRISMSRASLLKAVDEYAEDGKTIINPENGHMAGNCIAVKNRDRTTQKVASIFGSKSTKHRWYEIKNGLLKWWSEKKKSDEPDGIIDASEFIGINMTSDDPELLKSTSFGFEVVMKDRIIVLGCTSEEDRIKWTTALLMSFNSAVIKKYRHNVSKAIKLTDQQEKDCLRRRKYNSIYAKGFGIVKDAYPRVPN